MKIVDCFIFYNELDLLQYRLEILYDIVDYFVIVESKYTHNGKEKQLYFQENIEKIQKYMPKIVHIILDTFPYIYPNINYDKREQWENEHFQRNQIILGLNKIQMEPNDIFTICDLDEIPNPNLFFAIKHGNFIIDKIYSLEQDFYYYNLNTNSNTKWYHPKICNYGVYKMLNLSCEQIRAIYAAYIIHGGWHLSYFGDSKFIQNKLSNFAHQEYNNDEYNNEEIIKAKIGNQMGLFENLSNTKSTLFTNIPVSQNPNLPPRWNEFLMKYVNC